MAQRIDNIYRIVTFPAFYRGFHAVLGADAARRRFVEEMLRPQAGERILDVGCGPGTYVPYLPHADYTGIDLNPKHIEFCLENYAGRGTFLVGDVTKVKMPADSYDLINLASILHHIDDDPAKALISALVSLLAPGGRLITSDPTFLPRQRAIARVLTSLDSGQNVRDPEGYASLVDTTGARFEGKLYDDFFRIPYDHYCMTISAL